MPNASHTDARRMYDLTFFTCSSVFFLGSRSVNMLQAPRYLKTLERQPFFYSREPQPKDNVTRY